MGKLYKFGIARACPHCNGNAHEKAFEADEVALVKKNQRPLHQRRESVMLGLRSILSKNLKGRQEQDVEDAITYQASIEQLNHDGWPIDVTAWANVCPACDRVTEIRAVSSANFRPTAHGPDVESGLCTDCLEKEKKQ